jgi:hypothetical protein
MDESNQPQLRSMDKMVFQKFKSRFTSSNIALLYYDNFFKKQLKVQ